MAKRYHGSYEDRDDVRRQERKDGSMVPNGNGAHAGMPTEVVMKAYSDDNSYMPENLDDTIKGIAAQKGLDNGKKRAHLAPKKV
jgi:hypothetical protein